MKEVIQKSFHLNLTVMKIIGLYSSSKYPRIYKMYAYVIYVLAMMPSTIFGLFHFILSEDNSAINYSDFVMVGMIFYAPKLLPFVINGEKIKKCIHYFDASHYTVRRPEHKNIIEECVHSCQRNSRVFFVGCIAGLIGFICQIFIRENIHQLPLNIWLPPSIEKNPIFYYSFYFLLVMGKCEWDSSIWKLANLYFRVCLCCICVWNN
jgi:hypothetical protein